jgi:hypothetical protein
LYLQWGVILTKDNLDEKNWFVIAIKPFNNFFFVLLAC